MKRYIAPTLYTVFLASLLTTYGWLLGGCGGSGPFGTPELNAQRAEDIDRVLNIITDVVDPLYEASVLGCDATEGLVIEQAETREEAEAELGEVRGVCDRIFAGFETVRNSQRLARAAVVALREDESDGEKLGAVLEAVDALQDAAREAQRIWAQGQRQLTNLTETN